MLKPRIWKQDGNTIVESIINGKLIDTEDNPPKDMFGRPLNRADIVVVNYGGARWGNYLGVIESSEGGIFYVKSSDEYIKKYKISENSQVREFARSRTKVLMKHLKNPKICSNNEESSRFIIVPPDWLNKDDENHTWCLKKQAELLV